MPVRLPTLPKQQARDTYADRNLAEHDPHPDCLIVKGCHNTGVTSEQG